ncbi:MAG TPA: CaiB/BaiF CoA-transferase family protein [Roseiarcus sp.]|nr:CaiB/BaiF CoA-transferase family protein [Roseiarcus sp.]
MTKGPLDGLLVVALEQAVAAPFCTSRLADAGARVIKIERESGDFARFYDEVAHGESAYFVWLNRGKESVVLDIKEPRDAALLHAILLKADVFVQNLAPGAARRAGFGAAALRAANPRLIVCDITGYGEEGPYASMKAYDLLIQCETGLASITGGPGEPGRVGVSVADIGCGMSAHAAILQALYERERTGVGRSIAVSLFDTLADWMAVPLIHRDHTGVEPRRAGLNHATIAPYGAYAAGDGRQVVISIQNEAEWASLCRNVLGNPDLAKEPRFSTNSRRCEHRDSLDAEIRAVFSRLPFDELVAALKSAQIAFGRVNAVGDFARHPHLRRIEIATPTGPVSIPAPPQIFDGEGLRPGAVPAIGSHSDAIRREFNDSSVADKRQAGA